MNDNQQTPARPRQDRHGTNNPFWGHRHTEQSREKMRQAATERNKQYQQWKSSQQHPMTMDEFLSNHPVVDEQIRKLIREEIQKLIYDTRLRDKTKVS